MVVVAVVCSVAAVRPVVAVSLLLLVSPRGAGFRRSGAGGRVAALGGDVVQFGPRPVEAAGGLVRGDHTYAGARTGHLVPQPVDGLLRLRTAGAAHHQQVRVDRGERPPPAALAQHPLHGQPGLRPADGGDQEDAGEGPPQQALGQVHRKTPSRQA